MFLHQAVLSTLVASQLEWEQVRLLPPEYNYPLHLLEEMTAELRPVALDQLVNVVYEDSFPWGEIESVNRCVPGCWRACREGSNL